MKIQLARMSTDLRRISYWLLSERDELVSEMLIKMKNKYQVSGRVGIFPNIWLEIEKLSDNSKSNYIKSDYATTLSSILLQESLKL
jgi:hypothetical protein